MKLLMISGIALLALCITACSNKSEIEDLTSLDPASNEYKQELVKIISERGDELTYTFNKYFKAGGKDYLNVTVDGRGGLHADANIMVTKWTKLEGIKRTKGIGYSGAELHNLKVSLLNPGTNPVMVYQDVDHIAD
ncbi:MAG: hypothetical protein V4619_07535 [Bacteroidota bacterium]